MTRSKVLSVTAVSFLALTAFLGLFLSYFLDQGALAGKATSAFESVEIEVAELSPNGEEGGYAVPASNDSYGCTLNISPTSIIEGSGPVSISVTGVGAGVSSMTLTGPGLAAPFNPSLGYVDNGVFGLGAGLYTYQVTGSETIPGGAPICLFMSTEGGGCVWWSSPHDSINTYSCSANLTVNVPPPPDLRAINQYPSIDLSINNPPNIAFDGELFNDAGATLPGELITGTLEVDLNNNTCASPIADINVSAGNFGTVFSGPGNLAATVNASSLKNGIHCYRFRAAGASNDLDKGNNDATWTKFTITGLPDSTADLQTENKYPSSSQSFTNPSSITFLGTTTNTGLEATLVGQQIWGDVEIDWNKGTSCLGAVAEQTFNAGGPWTQLAVGGKKDLKAVVSAANLQNGNHCYRMIVDRDNFVAESNDTNNAGTPWLRFIVTGLGGGAGNPAPSGDIKANGSDNPAPITAGTRATLTWSSADTKSCTVSGGGQTWSGVNSTSSVLTNPLSVSTLYSLKCSNDDYTNVLVDSVTVAVTSGSASAISIDAEKKNARLNEPVDIIWNTGVNTDCRITAPNGYDSGTLPAGTGSDEVRTKGTTTYTLTCPSAGTRSVTIELIPGIWED